MSRPALCHWCNKDEPWECCENYRCTSLLQAYEAGVSDAAACAEQFRVVDARLTAREEHYYNQAIDLVIGGIRSLLAKPEGDQ